MIVFAAIAPHSPLLLPTIGKEHQKKLKKTLTAYQLLEEDCYAAKPQTFVVLSPHGAVARDSFSLTIADPYRANLKEFGDLTTALTFRGNPSLIERIRALRYKDGGLPLSVVGDEALDYGAVVPLYFLTQHLKNASAVPLGDAHLSLQRHFEAGKLIGDVLQKSTSRIAVVASADLAHTLTDAAPGGFSPAGKKFDEAVVQALRKDDRAKILKLEHQAKSAKACGLRVIAMLLGILDGMNCTPEPLSYEGPFGVGYLTVRYVLH